MTGACVCVSVLIAQLRWSGQTLLLEVAAPQFCQLRESGCEDVEGVRRKEERLEKGARPSETGGEGCRKEGAAEGISQHHQCLVRSIVGEQKSQFY